MYILNISKTNSFEKNLYRRQPLQKTTSIEDNFFGRQPFMEEGLYEWNMTSMEDDFNGRQPQESSV